MLVVTAMATCELLLPVALHIMQRSVKLQCHTTKVLDLYETSFEGAPSTRKNKHFGRKSGTSAAIGLHEGTTRDRLCRTMSSVLEAAKEDTGGPFREEVSEYVAGGFRVSVSNSPKRPGCKPSAPN